MTQPSCGTPFTPPTMKPRSWASLAVFLCLCETVAALSVDTDPLFSLPVRGAWKEGRQPGNIGWDLEAPSTTLSKRAAVLDRSLTISIIVGVIGGVAMVVALILGLLLVLRKQRERQRIRDLARSAVKGPPPLFPSTVIPLSPPAETFAPASKEHPYAYQHLPPASPDPVESRRPTNLQSAWFLDEEESKRNEQTVTSGVAFIGEGTVVIEPSGPKNAQSYSATNSKPFPPDPTSVQIPNRSESLHGRTKSSTRTLPPPVLQPIHESQPPGQPSSGVISPRPRGSSLGTGSRPLPIQPPPAAGLHLASVSEDIRPVSRFSMSPVARSFPSRLAFSPTSSRSSSSRRHTRVPGIGSLSTLVKSPTWTSTTQQPMSDQETSTT
ncbi:hypothetical protein B0H16DRAFT_1541330 [Mycena metata]|uniref:Transmembrane protein n=1 Tax=Mycena metata TaxID=1033252 RepID=A0AAD7NCN2_9AGAR|nr:hypothetical protein B0H16DRAFT_1541330 [Mycena metata]